MHDAIVLLLLVLSSLACILVDFFKHSTHKRLSQLAGMQRSSNQSMFVALPCTHIIRIRCGQAVASHSYHTPATCSKCVLYLKFTVSFQWLHTHGAFTNGCEA